MKKLTFVLLTIIAASSLNAIRVKNYHQASPPGTKALKDSTHVENKIVVLENAEEAAEEAAECSDKVKDAKKAKKYLQLSKQMMKLSNKSKDNGDPIGAGHYKNKAIAYGVMSKGYKIGNQTLIDKGKKLLATAKALDGE